MGSTREHPTDRLVPVAEGLFTIPSLADEPPLLLASKCAACDETFFPRRTRCARCSGTELTEVALSAEGLLHTWTVVGQQGGRSGESQSYTVGVLQVPEGLRVQGYVVGAEPDTLTIDMPMRLTLHVLSQDEQGNEVVTYAFTPAEDRA